MPEPHWLTIARGYIGVKEIPGPKENSTIQMWLKRLRSWIKSEDVPWCGTFCAAVMQEADLPYPKEWFRAREWAAYGANLRATHVAPGAILVFSRAGGGHVGFYVGESKLYYYVLGGNQKNRVNIDPIAKARCIAIRWPRGVPVTGGPVHMSGGVVSTNEA
jgi:uncharacterized protein (TIGR02594 family)